MILIGTAGIGTFIGALLGGIIGNANPYYESFDLDKNKYDKKKDLERILKIDKKLNAQKF